MQKVKDELKTIVAGAGVTMIEQGLTVGTWGNVSIYNIRPDVNAVIHDHPLYSSVLGVTRTELPGICEDLVQIVGDKVICSQYALPGTPELAQNAVEALGDRNAVLLPNHGTLCVGENLKHALMVCHVVEKAAHIYIMAMSIGTPHLLAEGDIKSMQYFARHLYGQRQKNRQPPIIGVVKLATAMTGKP